MLTLLLVGVDTVLTDLVTKTLRKKQVENSNVSGVKTVKRKYEKGSCSFITDNLEELFGLLLILIYADESSNLYTIAVQIFTRYEILRFLWIILCP